MMWSRAYCFEVIVHPLNINRVMPLLKFLVNILFPANFSYNLYSMKLKLDI